jgi:hypothetical protein
MQQLIGKYNVLNWYWFVGGNTSQVYSSLQAQYVPSSDATYLAWTANNTTTNILNATELFQVLSLQWIPLMFAAGISLTSINTPALNGNYPLDPQSQAYITSIAASIAAGKGLPGKGSRRLSFIFNGTSFTSADFLNFAAAVRDYVYNLVQDLQQIVDTGTGSLPSSSITIP